MVIYATLLGEQKVLYFRPKIYMTGQWTGKGQRTTKINGQVGPDWRAEGGGQGEGEDRVGAPRTQGVCGAQLINQEKPQKGRL